MGSRLTLGSVLCSLLACASPQDPHAFTTEAPVPGQVPRSEDNGPNAAPTEKELELKDLRTPNAKSAPSPDKIAERLKDDRECTKEVERLGLNDMPAAWALLKACVERQKYRDIKSVLEGRFRPHLDGLGGEEIVAFIAHLVAIRGADFGMDLPVAQSHGVAIGLLDDAFEEPQFHKGRYVMFVGLVDERRQRNGRVEMEISELGAHTEDRAGSISHYHVYKQTGNFGKKEVTGRSYLGTTQGKVGSESYYTPTGRRIVAKAAGAPQNLGQGAERVFLARFETASRPDDGTEQVAKVTFLHAYMLGPEQPDF